MAYNNIHLPRGYEVAVQTDPATPDVYTDLGVTYAEASMEFTYDVNKWTGSAGEAIKTFFQNMAISTTFDLAQIEMSNIHKLMSGASGYSATAASPVAGATQTIASGSWEYDKFIPIANQNGDGSAITINSVTLGTDGAIVLDTDYYAGFDAQGKYGIWIIDSATVTTEAQSVVINYDYTPSASRKLTFGSNSVDITPRALRLRKNLGTVASPKYFTVYIYSAVNESGLSMTFPRFDATDPTTLSVTMTGQLDETRSDLDQLFSIVDEYGTANNAE